MGVFNLSHSHASSGNMGELLPIMCREVLPSDVWRQQSTVLIRTSPLVSPVMHEVIMRVYHFFVPNRIVDSEWEDYITTKNGRDANAPTITLTTGSLADYLGLQVVNGDQVIAHPIRAYNLIWNEWFRDQDIQAELSQDQQTLQRVAWNRDYFTQARPEEQQGTTVTIPITGAGGTFPVTLDPDNTGGMTAQTFNKAAGANQPLTRSAGAMEELSVTVGAIGDIDINDMRSALFQKALAEQRARYGSRYEDVLAQFGRPPQDGRLQRPELLGGASRPVAFSEVVATAEGTTVVPGDLYGHGIGVATHRPFRRVIPEHGWVLSLLSVTPRGQYMNQVPRQFLRDTPVDFWWPESEIEGPQEIFNREVYAAHSDPTGTFGWTGRHDEYRTVNSYVSGEMRSNLDTYTYARNFTSDPALNASFIAATPTDRVYSDTAVDQLRIFSSHRIRARRMVSQRPLV